MITERIQALIDRHIAGSPRARELIAALDGKSLRIDAAFTPWQVMLRADGGRLAARRGDTPADAVIRGTPLALLALIRENPLDVIRRGDVKIAGDSHIAEGFQELLQLLRPDLEEELSRVVGDAPAYSAASFLRSAINYGRNSAQTARKNIGEYLAHEKRLLVPRAEAVEFMQGVDDLRERCDRLTARVVQLESTAATERTP
jgi:ubiquinone biosynthesis accessory factor UbiJ